MGALLGLMLGTGLLLIWSAWRGDGWRRGPRSDTSRLESLLQRAGVAGVTPTGVILLCGCSGLGAGLVMLAVSGTLPVAVAFAVMAAYLPVAALRGRAQRRQRELAELWPEAVDNLASAVRAGLSLPEALSALGTRGPEVLRPPFARFAADHRSSGRFGDGLDRLKADLADPVGDRIVETLRVAREVGGSDLGRVLRTLAGFLREDARARAELETRQGWVVQAARLAVAAPWAVLLLLATQSATLAAYDTPVGTALLLGGGAVCLVAYRLMLRIGRLPQDVRVLR